MLNPVALRMAKTRWSFGLSECKRVKPVLYFRPASSEYLSPTCALAVFDVFVMLLHRIPNTKLDQVTQCNVSGIVFVFLSQNNSNKEIMPLD